MALLALMPVTARPAVPAPTLLASCGRQPKIACQLVWDVTQNQHLAQLTNTYLAGPAQLILKIAFVVVLALVPRAFASRLISRITKVGAREPGFRPGRGSRREHVR